MQQDDEDFGYDEAYDIVVIGSGAAGLTTGLVAACEGLKPLVLEKTSYFGGTTSYSAGTCWIPNSRYVKAAGIEDDEAQAQRYLEALVGDRGPRQMWQTYLDEGPAMIDYLDRAGITFIPFPGFVDYYPELPGAGRGYRALEPTPFDGRRLGRVDFPHLRGPVPEFALFGGSLMVRRTEVYQLLALLEGSPAGIPTALRLGVRWAWDLVNGWPRGTRMVMGNALIANLYHQMRRRGGQMWLDARPTELLTEGGRVTGAVVQHDGRVLRVAARRGVVLAAGGFPASPQLRDEYLRQPSAQYTRAVESATGDTFALAQSVGGTLGPQDDDGALWFPSSVGSRRDGSQAVFPHIWDRAKPGMIAVNAAGKRFTDEARSYNHFVRAMYESNETVPTVPAWLVVDQAHLTRYGLGMVYPRTPRPLLRRWLRSGYLVKGDTPRALAEAIGVDPGGLEQTLKCFNEDALKGVDTEFHKGESPYSPQYGDPKHEPNVNLGPVDTPPYYAMAVYPTPLSTGRGIQINPQGQVLRADGSPVAGLYAAGSDAQQVFGVQYPGGGCQVGAGMTFGYIISKHAARRPVTA